jgi:hypothetical protein
MSLDFDFTKCVKPTDRFWVPDTSPGAGKDRKVLRGVTHVIVWQTMLVDLGSITEKNIDEWMFRTRLASRFTGDLPINEFRGKNHLHRNITREELMDHIGLRTNVVSKSRAIWLKRMLQLAIREVERDVAKETTRQKTDDWNDAGDGRKIIA